MFEKIFRKNEELRKEKKRLIRENQNLKKINWNNNIKIVKTKILVNKTINKLEEIQKIDRKGTREENKRKERNILISNLKKENFEIIKLLTNNDI